MKMRVEQDMLGEAEVPMEAYWGIHTHRAAGNFALSGQPVPAVLIHAIAQVKKAACMTNANLGYLSEDVSTAILQACDEIIDGKLDSEFPLDVLQGGAGTSTNMNVNEVLANRALELLGRNKGDYDFLHPIVHVNKHQSTNDVYPTALKVAAIQALRRLSDDITTLQDAFQEREQEFREIVKIGRTETQEAVPMTLGAEFAAFAEAFARDRWRTFKCEERLRVVNLGGTAIGTGLTAPTSYIFAVVERLRELTGIGLARGENLVDQTANADCFVEVTGILSAFAANLAKTARDLRLLHQLGEIRLPPVQAGSSIMPGKVNPVILEATISTTLIVKANTAVVTDAAGMGTLQINEFMPVIAAKLLESITLLSNTARMLAEHVTEIAADAEQCRALLDASPALITAFVPAIGYKKCEDLLKDYEKSECSDFRAFLNDALGSEVVDKTLSPANVMALGHR